MSAELSPEAEDLVDGLVGVVAMARRARALVEDVAVAGPSELPAADEELVLVMVGIVAMAKRLEGALGGWQPGAVPVPALPMSTASMRGLLR